MVKVEKILNIGWLKISLLAEIQVGFQYKAGRVSSVTDLAAFTQSHSPHSRDFRVRRNQAFNPCKVYLPSGTLEEKLERILPTITTKHTFPKKAQIPLMLFALVRPSVSFSIWAERTPKTHGCCQAFPPCHLRCLVFPHFSFPTAAGSNSVLPSRVWSGFCASITLATWSISFHPEHCCKYPRNSHPPSGKIQITESKGRFSRRESRASIGQYTEPGSLF